jgi:hypothetical protein
MKICTCGASPRRVERVCAGASGGLVEVRGGAGGASRCGFGCVRRSHDASHAGARRGAVVGEVRWFSAEAREVVKSVRCATCGKACIVRRTRSLILLELHKIISKLAERDRGPAVRPETGRARGPETRARAEHGAERSLETASAARPQRRRASEAESADSVGSPDGGRASHTVSDWDCAWKLRM